MSCRRGTRGAISKAPLKGGKNKAERNRIYIDQVAQESSSSQGKRYGDIVVSDSAQAHLGDTINHNHFYKASYATSKFQTLHASLGFGRMHARVRNVAAALPNTCQWVFDHEHFLAWNDLHRIQEHNGFLWIKGKPGSGKSTVMKVLLAWTKKTFSTQIVLSYFFNARSPDQLEKSTLGLYRSLTHQFLDAHVPSRVVFEHMFGCKERGGKVEDWTEVELQNFILEIIPTVPCPPVVILIDALDEGDDDDVRRMVRFLERLAKHMAATPGALRICFSSRHYPHISIEKSLTLVLEAQRGHKRDVQEYILSELISGDMIPMRNIRQRLWEKSNGVFLWVVLVVAMLNKASDSGKSSTAMLQILEGVPSDLHDVFSHLLNKDADDSEECMALLEWVLFAVRPMEPFELHHAIRQTCPLVDKDSKFESSLGTTAKYLLHCSRGLVEMIDDYPPSVQFIHETIRDYLLSKSSSKLELSTSEVPRSITLSFRYNDCHADLAASCLKCLLGRDLNNVVAPTPGALGLRSNTRGIAMDPSVYWPFAQYAAENWWIHVNEIKGSCGDAPLDLASKLLLNADQIALQTWVQLWDILSRYADPRLQYSGYTPQDLFPPLHYAVATGNTRLVIQLLRLGADVNAKQPDHPVTALCIASDQGFEELVQILIDAKADVNAGVGPLIQGRTYPRNPLQYASVRGYEKIVRILIDAGADIEPQRREPTGSDSPLRLAAENGRKTVVQMLLDAKADINERSGSEGSKATAVLAAIIRGGPEVIQLLIDARADLDKRSGSSNLTPLEQARKWDRQPEISILEAAQEKAKFERR